MKYICVLVSIVITLIAETNGTLAQLSSGTRQVEKTVCRTALGHDEADELKVYLATEAKKEAVAELFGEFLNSYTEVENSTITKDTIKASSAGIVRLAGNPLYTNHESNFAEVCISITAYVTKEDLEKFQPVELREFGCETDPKLTSDQKQKAAEINVVVKALSNYEPELEIRDPEELLSLLKNRKFDGSFDKKTGVYCTTVTGEILPIEVVTLLASDKFTNVEQPLTPSPKQPSEGEDVLEPSFNASVDGFQIFVSKVQVNQDKVEVFFKGLSGSEGWAWLCYVQCIARDSDDNFYYADTLTIQKGAKDLGTYKKGNMSYFYGRSQIEFSLTFWGIPTTTTEFKQIVINGFNGPVDSKKAIFDYVPIPYEFTVSTDSPAATPALATSIQTMTFESEVDGFKIIVSEARVNRDKVEVIFTGKTSTEGWAWLCFIQCRASDSNDNVYYAETVTLIRGATEVGDYAKGVMPYFNSNSQLEFKLTFRGVPSTVTEFKQLALNGFRGSDSKVVFDYVPIPYHR